MHGIHYEYLVVLVQGRASDAMNNVSENSSEHSRFNFFGSFLYLVAY